MIFLANENFPFPSIRLLRESGFFVKSIGEEFGGISDEEVMRMAVEKGFIILTFDRDYGELIFKYQQKAPPAIVYFRTKGNNPQMAAETILELIANDFQIESYFTVIEETGIRQRKLHR